MLSVLDTANIIREADSNHPSASNPWSGHTRLQAMVEMCKTTDALLWCSQAVQFMVSQNQLTGLSAADIEGGAKGRGNKAIFNVLLYKRALKDALSLGSRWRWTGSRTS